MAEAEPKQPAKIGKIQEEEKCAIEDRRIGLNEVGEQQNLEQYKVGKLFEIGKANLENELEMEAPEVKIEENESVSK